VKLFLKIPLAMYQHQHAPLPPERLKYVPPPVVVLLEKLLEKDPTRRFQAHTNFLKAIPTITRTKGQRVTRQGLQCRPAATYTVDGVKCLANEKRPIRSALRRNNIARIRNDFGRSSGSAIGFRRILLKYCDPTLKSQRVWP
jgi:hypothetical protein